MQRSITLCGLWEGERLSDDLNLVYIITNPTLERTEWVFYGTNFNQIIKVGKVK